MISYQLITVRDMPCSVSKSASTTGGRDSIRVTCLAVL